MIDLPLARTNLHRWRFLAPAHGPDYHYSHGHLLAAYDAALEEIADLRQRLATETRRTDDQYAERRAA